MIKNLLLTGALLILSGCSTPAYILKNEAPGQIARCGGDATGSIVGGQIGFNIQKRNDGACVKAYESQGFKAIK
jgi:hypothetical protein